MIYIKNTKTSCLRGLESLIIFAQIFFDTEVVPLFSGRRIAEAEIYLLTAKVISIIK